MEDTTTTDAPATTALVAAFRSEWSSLVGLARLLDRDDAEGLVQEAFVRVYAGLDRQATRCALRNLTRPDPRCARRGEDRPPDG